MNDSIIRHISKFIVVNHIKLITSVTKKLGSFFNTMPNREKGISVASVSSPRMIRIDNTRAIIENNFNTGLRSFKYHSHSKFIYNKQHLN